MTPEERIQDALARGLVRTGNRPDAYGIAGPNSEPAVAPAVAPEPEPLRMIPVPRRAKAEEGQTYFGRMQAGLEDGANAGYLVGSELGVRGPYAPSPITWDTENVEPPLGEDVNAVPDMNFVPHGGSALLLPQEEPEAETDE